jgi:hypothetical protein
VNEAKITPAARRLLGSVAIALLTAVFVLVVFILPAEYAVDPTGAGRLLGLTTLGESKQVAANQAGVAVAHSHERKYRSANIIIEVQGREELEYKATLAAGEPLLYSWRVEGGSPVYFEFHGEPTEGEWPKDYFQSYEIQERSTQAHGSFVAPFTGQHGWYWRNLSAEPIKIVLETSGYYSRLGRIEGGGASIE